MCEQQCDPVMALLEELAQARGYALTPIIQLQEVARQTEPDPLAEFKAQVETMPLKELFALLSNLREKVSAARMAAESWQRRARKVARAEFARWRNDEVRLSDYNLVPPENPKLEREARDIYERYGAAEDTYQTRLLQHVRDYAIANTPESEESA